MGKDACRYDFKEEPGTRNLALVGHIYFILNFRDPGSEFLPVASVPGSAMAQVGKWHLFYERWPPLVLAITDEERK